MNAAAAIAAKHFKLTLFERCCSSFWTKLLVFVVSSKTVAAVDVVAVGKMDDDASFV
jgi:hypothetical protein